MLKLESQRRSLVTSQPRGPCLRRLSVTFCVCFMFYEKFFFDHTSIIQQVFMPLLIQELSRESI